MCGVDIVVFFIEFALQVRSYMKLPHKPDRLCVFSPLYHLQTAFLQV